MIQFFKWAWAKITGDYWVPAPWHNHTTTRLTGPYCVGVDVAKGEDQSVYTLTWMDEEGNWHYKPITQEEYYKTNVSSMRDNENKR